MAGEKVDRPSGTRDFLPKDMNLRNWIIRKVEKVFKSFGYQQVQTPIFEKLRLFEIRSGEKFRDYVFTFKSPRDEGAEDLYVLRPELTAPTCRMVSTSKLSRLPKPVKLFYIGQCFRYDNPEPGRYREFWQAGIELLGSPYHYADAEIITIAYNVLEEIGIKEYLIALNDINILRQLFYDFNINFDEQNKILGVIDSVGSAISKDIKGIIEIDQEQIHEEFRNDLANLNVPEELKDILMRLVYIRGQTDAMEEAKKLFEKYPKAKKAFDESPINLIVELLQINNISNFEIDFSIARGLDFYTGIVFEIYVDVLERQRQICGGGRYDKLVEEYGGPSIPATGFAFGLDRLCIAAAKLNIVDNSEVKKPRSDVYILPIIENKIIFKMANELRAAGISTEIDLMRRNIGKGLGYASDYNIPIVIIMGKKEIENNLVSIKDMNTKKQYSVPYEEFLRKVKEILKK
ncbi:MAG: histidine--tRNA ligase [Promethearchaeota archaeon]